jgi:ABC-2 type transport system permease protein
VVKVLTLVRVEVMRFLRDRSNLFFVFLFPLLLIVFIGAQFGDAPTTDIGLVAGEDDPVAAEVRDALDDLSGIEVVDYDDPAVLADDVERGLVRAGLVLPPGFADAVRAVEPVEATFHGRPDATSASLQTLVASVLAEREQPGAAAALLAAGQEATGRAGADVVTLREHAITLGDHAANIEVSATTLGTDELAEEFAGLGQFDLGASSQLFLFTFLTSLAGSAALIQTRQLGVARRMLSTPTGSATILAGIAGGRLAVALFQAGYIIVATRLLFDVDWGDPLATTAVVLLFAITAAAAGMLVGSVFSNDSQASGAGVGLGLGMAALGGSMVPLELYPATVARVAHLTPHAWANEAMAELVRRDGTITDILPQLAALGLFAVVVSIVGAVTLQRALSR